MKARTKARMALAAGALLVMAGTILGAWLWCQERAATDPAPSPLEADGGRAAADDGFPEVDWGYWQSVNPDVIGWVTVPGTNIDQPIVQAPADDPTYYLSHDVYRSWSVYGCPYLDAGCAEEGFDSPVALVFGHHMSDGSMFSEFAKYSSSTFAEEHAAILLQTPTRKMRLAVIAADVVNTWSESKQIEFKDSASYEEWLADLLAGADVVVGGESAGTAGVKAFCTCSYGPWSGHERTIAYAASGAGASLGEGREGD